AKGPKAFGRLSDKLREVRYSLRFGGQRFEHHKARLAVVIIIFDALSYRVSAAVIKLLRARISDTHLQHHRKNIAVRQCSFEVSEQHLAELSTAVFGRYADRRQMAETRFRDHYERKSDKLA